MGYGPPVLRKGIVFYLKRKNKPKKNLKRKKNARDVLWFAEQLGIQKKIILRSDYRYSYAYYARGRNVSMKFQRSLFLGR